MSGRGTPLRPPNRFETTAAVEEPGPAEPSPATTLLSDDTRSVINAVDPVTRADIGYAWTLNPYRGCEHGCIYCYARPGHETLGMSCGLDFETRIVAKHDAPRLLARELAAKRWRGEPILMSGVTDPYQPVERSLALTRQCLQVMARHGQPVAVVTKNRLVLRDLDCLRTLAATGAARVAVSLTTLDPGLAAVMEPRASAPRDRLATIEQFRAAGVPVTVLVAPVIVGLNDREIPGILEAAAGAGAGSASYVLLRLPHGVKQIFLAWLQRHFPDRAARVESLIRQTHGGRLYDPHRTTRMRGTGVLAEQVGTLFRRFARRHRLDRGAAPLSSEAFLRRRRGGQMLLFD